MFTAKQIEQIADQNPTKHLQMLTVPGVVYVGTVLKSQLAGAVLLRLPPTSGNDPGLDVYLDASHIVAVMAVKL